MIPFFFVLNLQKIIPADFNFYNDYVSRAVFNQVDIIKYKYYNLVEVNERSFLNVLIVFRIDYCVLFLKKSIFLLVKPKKHRFIQKAPVFVGRNIINTFLFQNINIISKSHINISILIHNKSINKKTHWWNSGKKIKEMQHIYLCNTNVLTQSTTKKNKYCK